MHYSAHAHVGGEDDSLRITRSHPNMVAGTKTEKYLLENLKALDIKLTASELEELNNLDPPEES